MSRYTVTGYQRQDDAPEVLVGTQVIEADGPDTALVNAWPLFPQADVLVCLPLAGGAVMTAHSDYWPNCWAARIAEDRGLQVRRWLDIWERETFAVRARPQIKALAEAMGVAPSTLATWCQRRDVPDPGAYLGVLRATRAVTMRARGMPTSEVAWRCGYSSESALCRSVRTHLHQTLTECVAYRGDTGVMTGGTA